MPPVALVGVLVNQNFIFNNFFLLDISRRNAGEIPKHLSCPCLFSLIGLSPKLP